MALSLYDEKGLARQIKVQEAHHWDLETSIPWNVGLDLQKPLVPIDSKALLFPGASDEQRLAISQMMGLMIAQSICEMEECLLRLRLQGWDQIARRFPVNPEFIALGDLFFEEESKHSKSFRRYLEKYALALGVEPAVFDDILPRIEGTKTESMLRLNLHRGGQAFWWIVASVEQEFLRLFKALEPQGNELDPLYYTLHEKHYEEELRHASFPYLILELLMTRDQRLASGVHRRLDLAFAQLLKTVWTVHSLGRFKKVRQFRNAHPFFDVLSRALPLLERQPPHRILWSLLTSTPYVSSLVNPRSHRKIVRVAERSGAFILPFPEYRPDKWVA